MMSETSRLEQLRVFAEQHFARHLAANRYPGRGIVIGRLAASDVEDAGDAWVQVYWIMGRSAHSRNRRFVAGGDGVELRTEARDLSLVTDPSLIIYEAMLELEDLYIVSNGDHTRTIHTALDMNARFEDALGEREREDDPPNYTPRIAGLLNLRGAGTVRLSILRANAADPALTDHVFWRLPAPPPGLGYGITTYRSDGAPLPPYAGDPLWLPLVGSVEDVADTYWEALDRENRIALAAKLIDAEGSRIILRQSE